MTGEERGGGSGGSSGDDGATPDLGDLMHAAFRRLRRRWSLQLAPFDLTPYQFRALGVVGGGGPGMSHADHERAAAEGLRLKDVAERLRIAPRSATEVIDQLEAKGLVERGSDPADRRATRIRTTPAGADLRDAIRRARRREAGDYFSALSAADRAELARLLGRLAQGSD